MLINGAGGGVGTLALQITKAWGARVTAVDRTDKLDMLRTLGADEVVDYTREDFTRRGIRYDLIFDVPGTRPLADMVRALEPDGRYVPIGHEGFGASGRRIFGLIPHFLALMVQSCFIRQIRGPGVPRLAKKEAIAVLRELLASGVVTPVIDGTFHLGDVREAFRHMVAGDTRGKVIITTTVVGANEAWR